MARVDEIAAQEMQSILRIFEASDNSRIKLESFGIFLNDYVISGGEVTKVNNNKVKVSEAIISLKDFLWRVYEANLIVPKTNGTYYIDFDANNQMFVCVTEHPTYYMELAQVVVTNGEISNIIDTRGEIGGVRFNEEIWGVIVESIAVDNSGIVDKSISHSKLMDNAVGTDNIQDGSITTAKIADNTIGTLKIQDGSITNPKLADNAVDNSKLANNSVGTNNIQEKSITTNKLDDKSVSQEKLGTKSVTTEKIDDMAVTTKKIADGAVTESKLSINTLPESKLKLDYPTSWLYEVLTMIQNSGNADLSEVIAARQGYNTLSEKLDSMETYITHETFITTEGQTQFNLTKGEYVPGTNTLFVTIGGIPQDVLSGLQEINSTTFAVDEPLPAGLEIYAWWYNKRPIPATYHANAHKEGGGDSLDIGDLAHNQPVVIDGGEW